MLKRLAMVILVACIALSNLWFVVGRGDVEADTIWSPMSSGSTSNLYGVWGASASNVFAVGLGGTILHYNGSTWSTMSSGTTNALFGVWGTSASNVFAVGEGGKILRYNGSAWSAMTSPTAYNLYAAWGTSASNVFAVGAGGRILRYNGSSWSAMTSGTTVLLYRVWGTSGTDVFAVGDAGTIRHYNGSAWSAMTSGTADNLRGIWGTSPSDVFTASGSGNILHYNGSTWSAMTSGTTNALYCVWGTSALDVFVVGAGGKILHYNGSSWSAMTSGTTNSIRGIWGSSAADVFAVGDNGTILHYSAGTPPPAPTLVSPVNGAGAVGTSLTFQWNASAGATNYKLLVSTSPILATAKSNYLFSGEVGNVTQYTVSGFPNNNTNYYWWVWAGNGGGWCSDTEAQANFRNVFNTPTVVYGAGANPTGNPIGGGAAYSPYYTSADADAVVTTAAGLKAALAAASSGGIIYVQDGATITYTSTTTDWYSTSGYEGVAELVHVPAGVILAGGRGKVDVTPGKLSLDPATLNSGGARNFITLGAGAKVIGLHISGPEDSEAGTNHGWRGIMTANGASSPATGAEIANCEIHGMGHAGIYVRAASGVTIHHNYIHNCRGAYPGNLLGYGICIEGTSGASAKPIIEGNYFDYNRHSTAAVGGTSTNYPGYGYYADYEIRYNLFGSYAATPGGTQVDQHGGTGNVQAGGTWSIHHNTSIAQMSSFSGNNPFICIRGIPVTSGAIYNNWTYYAQTDYWSDLSDGWGYFRAISEIMCNITAYQHNAPYGTQTSPSAGPYVWVNINCHDNLYGPPS